MRVACGHDDGLALVQFIPDAVDRDAAHAVQAGDEGVAAGLVRADLLALVKGEQRDAQRVVLRQRLADDLPRLLRDLLLQRQHRRLLHVLDPSHIHYLLFKVSLFYPVRRKKYV